MHATTYGTFDPFASVAAFSGLHRFVEEAILYFGSIIEFILSSSLIVGKYQCMINH